MKQIKREGCGAGDCIFNVCFRCVREVIHIDETSKCLCYKLD